MMLLTTPVVGRSIGPFVGRAMLVGRISLIMLLTPEGRSGRSLTMLETVSGIVPSRMLLAAAGRLVIWGRSVVIELTMLLMTPVGRSVGRTSLTMLLSAEVRSLPVGRSVGRVTSLMMLDTPLGRPVMRGRPVGSETDEMSLGPGRSVAMDTTSLRMLETGRLVGTEILLSSEKTSLRMVEAAEGIKVGTEIWLISEITTLPMLETGRVVGLGRPLTPEKMSLMMLETGRPGKTGAEAEL
jgi:hypothetical protein